MADPLRVNRSLKKSSSRLLPSLLLATPILFGLTGDITEDPAKVVEKFMSLDKRGARLEAASYEVLRPYIIWEDEPAWGRVVVISEYEVSDNANEWEIINSMEAIIPVTFQVVGTMHWETATFLQERYSETVSIRVRAVVDRWRMIEPIFPPHVGRKRLIRFVRHAMLEEKDQERKGQLQQLQDSLKKAK